MKEIEQSLVKEFQQVLDRDLTNNERAFIKWMTIKQHCEYNNIKRLPKPSKVG